MRRKAAKLISVILSLMFALSMMQGIALAEEDQGEPIIRVDGADYYDMLHAMDAAGPGSEITLLDDISLENQVDISFSGGEPVTLDLNGNTITLYDPSNASGDDDSGAEDTGTGGVITLRGGSLKIVDYSGSEGAVHSLNASYPAIRLIQNYETGTGFSIEDGTFRSDMTAVITLLDANGNPMADPDGQTLSVRVSGGIFDEQLPASYIADGYELYQEEDGEWGVREQQAPAAFTVTWQNYDGTVLYTATVDQGTAAVYEGETPVRPDDADNTYTFTGWDQDTSVVSGDMTVTAQFEATPIIHTFTVTWQNYDGTVLYTATVDQGTAAVYEGETPVRPDDADNTYTFTGWDQDTSVVSGDMMVTAQFAATPIIHTYTVTWQNYDGTVLYTATVDQGTAAVYEGETPVRPDDADNTYTFTGWDQDTSLVSGDMTVTAQFAATPIIHTYTVTWQNYDGTVLYTVTVDQGTAAVYEGETPVRPDDADNTYTFTGWDQDTSLVSGDMTVTAQFAATPIIHTYTVTWQNYDGTVLYTATVDQGTAAIYEGETPVRPDDADNTYTFTGWDQATDIVTTDMTVTAQFAATPIIHTYTVTWQNYDGAVLYTATVDQGTAAVYEGETPVRPDDADNTYTFTGWDQPTDNVIADMTVTAQFAATPIIHTYTVTWQNYDGTVLQTAEDVAQGSAVSYTGDTPVRPDDEANTYTFSGWDQATDNVTADMLVTAQYTASPITKSFTVTWQNYDGQVLSQTQVAQGHDAVYDGETPVKPSDEENYYTFSGWDPKPVGVTEDMTVTAQFTASPITRTVTVTWQNYDGTVLYTATVDQGSAAVYEGETPVRPDDADNTYTFTGWDQDTSVVSGDMTVTAQFAATPIIHTFTVTWQNYDGTVLQTAEDVAQGSAVSYTGDTPVRPDDEANTYAFSGWDQATDNVTADMLATAQYTASPITRTFTVTWQNYDGQVLSQTKVAQGQDAVYHGETPVKPSDEENNYTFSGWDPQPAGVMEDMTVTAQFTAVPITYCFVTFDVDAEDVPIPDGQKIRAGEMAFDPGTPVRDGYGFAGWFLDGSDIPFVFENTPVYEDLVLRARWTQSMYLVSFDLNHEGAQGQPDAQQVAEGQTAAMPPAPTAEDAVFAYWTADPAAEGQPKEYDFSTPVTADLTLHGYWTAMPVFTVTFDANGGSGTMEAVTVKQGASCTLPACGFTAPEWMRFKGWKLGDQEYAPGAQITVSADAVVSAVWEEIPVYTITFHSNGGSGDMSAVTLHEGTSFILPECAFTPPVGKVFAGWDRGPAGKEIIMEGDLDLNAKWTNAPVVKCMISFDANGGTGTMAPVTVNQGAPFTIPANGFTAPSGKTFAGWDKGTPGSIITVGADAVLKALWTDAPTVPAVYSVTFYTAHGDIPVGQLVEEGQKVTRPADPKAEGYVFRGWYTEIEYTNIYDFNAPVSKNLTLYAKWEEEQTTKQFFTIAFFTEQGTAPAQQSVEKGLPAAKPADPSADGYVFNGWFTEKECKTLYDFNTPVTANLTLFAGWSEAPKQSFVVYFQSNGHGNTPNPQPVQSGQKIAKPQDPVTAGYTFTGWYTEPAAATAYDFDTSVTSDVTLYAGWTPNRYTVLFNSNEGTGTMASLSCTYDIRAALPADTFTRSGYKFTGWNTKADGSGISYNDKAVILNLTDRNGGTVPLYAQWKNIYSVIEGINAIVPKDGTSGVTFRVDGDYNKFTGITIDGQTVPMNQYTSWEGSTYVRLNQDYINKMAEGDHKVKFQYTDGAVETSFDIVSAAPAPAPRQRTNSLLLWIIIIAILLAVAICTAVVIWLRKRNTR